MWLTLIGAIVGAIFGAVGTYFFMRQQKQDERNAAIKTLLLELKKNKKYIDDTINFIEQGAHTGKQGTYSWTWNLPHTEAYERYLVAACEDDHVLTEEVIAFYTQIEGIKETTKYIQSTQASGIAKSDTSILGASAIAREITKRNAEIGEICKKLQAPVADLIRKLEDRLSLRHK